MLGLALGTATLLPAFAQTSATTPPLTTPTTPATTPTAPHSTGLGTTRDSTTRDSTTGANTTPPAVQTDSSRQNAAAPVPGANSFTESQARSRIEGAGFSDVTGLVKDDSGIWRGHARRSGQTANVSLDFQGNVASH
jgi:hypothetical protein